MVKCKHCENEMTVLSIDAQTKMDDPGDAEVHIDIICKKCDAGLTICFDNGEVTLESEPLRPVSKE